VSLRGWSGSTCPARMIRCSVCMCPGWGVGGGGGNGLVLLFKSQSTVERLLLPVLQNLGGETQYRKYDCRAKIGWDCRRGSCAHFWSSSPGHEIVGPSFMCCNLPAEGCATEESVDKDYVDRHNPKGSTVPQPPRVSYGGCNPHTGIVRVWISVLPPKEKVLASKRGNGRSVGIPTVH